MSSRCSFCETKTDKVKILILNKGKLWIEFCGDCKDKKITNADTGKEYTIEALWVDSKKLSEEKREVK